MAVPRLRLSVSGLLLHGQGFSPKPDHVGFVVLKAALGKRFSLYLGSPLALSFHHFTILIHLSPTLYGLVKVSNKSQFCTLVDYWAHRGNVSNWQRRSTKRSGTSGITVQSRGSVSISACWYSGPTRDRDRGGAPRIRLVIPFDFFVVTDEYGRVRGRG